MRPPSNHHVPSVLPASTTTTSNGIGHANGVESASSVRGGTSPLSSKGRTTNQPLPTELNGKKPAAHPTSPAQDRRRRLSSSNSLNDRLAQSFPSGAIQSLDSSRYQTRATGNDRISERENNHINGEGVSASQDPHMEHRSGNDYIGILVDSKTTNEQNFDRFGSWGTSGSLPNSRATEGGVYHINPHSTPSGSPAQMPHGFKYFPDNVAQPNFMGNRSLDQSKGDHPHQPYASSASYNQQYSSFSTSIYGHSPGEPLLGEYSSKPSFSPKSTEAPSFLPSSAAYILDYIATRVVQPIVTRSPESVGFVILCCMWYACSAITNNIGKLILNEFKFPVTLTFVQFGFVAAMCFLLSLLPKSIPGFSFAPTGKSIASWNARQKYSYPTTYSSSFPTSNIRRPTRSIILTTLPLSLFQIAGHVFSSIAISRVPVSFAHTIKALSPLFTVMIYRFLYRVKYSSQVYVALLPLTLGVMLACSFEFNADFVGFLCALGSCIIFVSQNIFSKKLLFKDSVAAASKPVAIEVLGSIGYEEPTTVTSVALGLPTGSGISSPMTAPRKFAPLPPFGRRAGGGFDGGASEATGDFDQHAPAAAAPPNGHTSSLSTVSTATPHLDKMNLLFYSSFMAFVLMSPLWLYSDGTTFLSPSFSFDDEHAATVSRTSPSPPSSSSTTTTTSALTLAGLFFVNGTTHFFQNFFAFSLLSITSPVTYSIASLVKRIFVIVASIVYFGQTVRVTQGIGICMTFTGLWMYNRAKRESANACTAADESAVYGSENGSTSGRSRSGGGILPTVCKRDF